MKRPDTRTQRTGQGRAIPIQIRPKESQLAPTDRGKGPEPNEASSVHSERGEMQGVYIISVAARLLEMHPQTLRKYERLGLVRPTRIIGTWRLYSDEDIEKLRLIKHLAENVGLNLAGVEIILRLLEHLMDMRSRLAAAQEAERFQNQIEQEMEQLFRNLNLPLWT